MLKNFTGNKKTLFFSLLAAGALLMVLGRFFTASFPSNEEAHAPYIPVNAQNFAETPDIRAAEERLEAFFSLVQGAGRVRVMLGMSNTRETVFAVDSNQSESFTREEDAQGGHRETRQSADQMQTVFIPDRNGTSRPLILRESEQSVEGIVIIAEGGDNPHTRAELTRAAQAVLGIEAHRIQVLTMAKN